MRRDTFGAGHHTFGPELHVRSCARFRRKIGKFVTAASARCISATRLRFATCNADRGPAPRFRRDARLPPAGAVHRQNDRDRPMSRSRRRPGFGQRHERSRPTALRLSPSTSSTLPSSAGVLAKPATSVRNRPISNFGIDAGFEPSIDLDHIVAIHQRGAVGTVRFQRRGYIRWYDLLARELAGRPEFKAQALFLDSQGLAQIAQQSAMKIWSVATSSKVPSRAPDAPRQMRGGYSARESNRTHSICIGNT